MLLHNIRWQILEVLIKGYDMTTTLVANASHYTSLLVVANPLLKEICLAPAGTLYCCVTVRIKSEHVSRAE